MNYNIDFFIDFYEKTKEEDWCMGTLINFQNQRCALGFCEIMSENYERYFEALSSLEVIFPKPGIAIINDGFCQQYQQATPKQRVLAALYDKRREMYPELSTVTVEDIIKEALTV